MSYQLFGSYFSANADGSANDKTVYVQMTDIGNMKLGARYKNSEPNHLYEIELDKDDLRKLGELLVALSSLM